MYICQNIKDRSMKLELKHLAGYLPYGLKYKNTKNDNIHTARTLSTEINMVDFGWGDAMDMHEVIPIFRPLSDLTKEIEHNGEKFVPKDWLNKNFIGETIGLNIATWSHRAVEKLREWKFDIFELIPNNLAVPVTDEFNPYK